jgi:hypothetical protein
MKRRLLVAALWFSLVVVLFVVVYLARTVQTPLSYWLTRTAHLLGGK